jgi:hypothetical protein
MKNLLLIVALLLTLNTQAQTEVKVAQDRNTGNYYEVSLNYCCPNSSQVSKQGNFIDKQGFAHPVIKTPAGLLYYNRTSSKTGKTYRIYLKVV